MATPAWPTGTAPFGILHASYRRSLEDNRHVFKPTVGPNIIRRKTTARTDVLQGNIYWTMTEWGVAEAFYTNDLEDGSKAFTVPDPADTSVTLTCRFTKPLDIQPAGLGVTASVQVEILP